MSPIVAIVMTLAAPGKPGAVDDLAWIEGTWVQQTEEKTTTEEWIRFHPDVLIGISTTVKDGKEVFIEHLTIAPVDGVLTYSAWPSMQVMAHFKLASKSKHRVVFENPAHDFPERITYWAQSGKLHAKVEGTPGGKKRVEEWAFSPKGAKRPIRKLEKTITVQASAKEVWAAWTTVEGAKTFFAPAGVIDPRPGGKYELYFAPNQPEGLRGSDGCRLIELVPEKKLVFTWNFPPSLPRIRNAHTLVTLKFTQKSPKETEISMMQEGYRQGPDWDKGLEYFDAAWGKVLCRLKDRFLSGPIDWSK